MVSQAVLYFSRKRRLRRVERQNSIFGDGPILSALADGNALSGAVSWGSYNNPTSVYRLMKINDGMWLDYDGATVVAENDVLRLKEIVSLDGAVVEFSSAMIEVSA